MLFFGSLSSELRTKQEVFELHEESITVNELKSILSSRNSDWKNALMKPTINCAVNQNLVSGEDTISSNDEVAFFPPVTGG